MLNYSKILNVMRTVPIQSLADMKELAGINGATIQKQLNQLIQNK